MNRSKIVAYITGAISILLAIAYLIIVQILDYRDMKPAPISQLNPANYISLVSFSRTGAANPNPFVSYPSQKLS
ncbi:hypothetical protein [Cylindrospermum sp. FACHB-282]|uniref:hypothetical protein n=1 Tax=Cylindrospermum sp. FACHB-282 TaxID=2692794 RepID=UPI0016845B0F|nr:hypothetical protein [Cylindrospermum sp. FACHB-282]MBD2385825.1 hypothetical protein [Cylindrospermum sp. FACHB-282]